MYRKKKKKKKTKRFYTEEGICKYNYIVTLQNG
jgi:hypothetical protein